MTGESNLLWMIDVYIVRAGTWLIIFLRIFQVSSALGFKDCSVQRFWHALKLANDGFLIVVNVRTRGESDTLVHTRNDCRMQTFLSKFREYSRSTVLNLLALLFLAFLLWKHFDFVTEVSGENKVRPLVVVKNALAQRWVGPFWFLSIGMLRLNLESLLVHLLLLLPGVLNLVLPWPRHLMIILLYDAVVRWSTDHLWLTCRDRLQKMSRSSLWFVLKVGTGPWVIFIAKQRSICTRPMRIFETCALRVEGSILIDSRIGCYGLILDTVTNTTHIIEVG